MDNIKTKIKLIFVPYLIISLATLIIWTYLHWLLFLKFNVYEVNENFITIILPSVLSLISILIWLYKKIKLLSIKSKNLIWFILVPCVSMGGLNLFGSQYIILATSKQTILSSISQIEKKEPTKFYELKKFYLDKKHYSLKKFFYSSGKHNNNLEMEIYVTVPILNFIKDTFGSNCTGWYGVKYAKTAYDFNDDHDIYNSNWATDEVYNNNITSDYYDNSINKIENSEEVKRFVNESLTQFDNLNLNEFLYLDRITKITRDYNNYISAIKNNSKYDTKSDVVLLPCNETLADRANDNLKIALILFVIGSILFLIMVINTNLKSEDEV